MNQYLGRAVTCWFDEEPSLEDRGYFALIANGFKNIFIVFVVLLLLPPWTVFGSCGALVNLCIVYMWRAYRNKHQSFVMRQP
jgi:hypothetical protein